MNEGPAVKYFCISPVLGRQVRKPNDMFSKEIKRLFHKWLFSGFLFF